MPYINEHLLDPHLNFFYSYDRGKYKTVKDKVNQKKQLEDNVTRALLITLSQLTPGNRKKFISELIGDIDNSIIQKDFYFDLQALSNDFLKLKDQSQHKILLTITRTGGISNDVLNVNDQQESRADGWIFNNDICILLEVKVGKAEVTNTQIERHITASKGFGVPVADVYQFHKKWQEVDSVFVNLKQDLEQEIEKVFVNQFRQLLGMIGETMNFRQFYENKSAINSDIRKNQLKLLMDRVVNSLGDDSGCSFDSEIKNWTYLKYKKEKNPHFSFSITENEMTCSLTVSESKQRKFKAFLLNKTFIKETNELIESNDYIKKARHILSLENYRLIDHKQGQQRGKSLSTFLIKLCFCENDLDGQKLSKVMEAMKNCLGLGKQLEFTLSIEFPKEGNLVDNGLMDENKKLLENPEEVISLFATFIKGHRYLADEVFNT